MNQTTKTQQLVNLMRAEKWDRALNLASTFKKLGEHRSTIVRANECRWHPKFFAQLGMDPETTVAAGIAALKTLYSPKGTDTMQPEYVPPGKPYRVHVNGLYYGVVYALGAVEAKREAIRLWSGGDRKPVKTLTVSLVED